VTFFHFNHFLFSTYCALCYFFITFLSLGISHWEESHFLTFAFLLLPCLPSNPAARPTDAEAPVEQYNLVEYP